jgi:hypothetical protein
MQSMLCKACHGAVMMASDAREQADAAVLASRCDGVAIPEAVSLLPQSVTVPKENGHASSRCVYIY